MTIGKTTDVRSDSIQKWNRESNTCFFFLSSLTSIWFVRTFEVLNMFYDFQDLKGKVLVGKVLLGKLLVGKFLVGKVLLGKFQVSKVLWGKVLVGQILVSSKIYLGNKSSSGFLFRIWRRSNFCFGQVFHTLIYNEVGCAQTSNHGLGW